MKDVQFRAIPEAPEAAKAVAEAIHRAFPQMSTKSSICWNSQLPAGGEVVVISNPGSDARAACLVALAICEYGEAIEQAPSEGRDRCTRFLRFAEHIELEHKDWNDHLQVGFNRDPDDDEDPEDFDDDDAPAFRAVTEIMAENLTRGFVFSFSTGVACSPMLYGGFASDGCIVGVLTTQVCW
eukprot:TRINITY_DN24539_c0_g1_i2.p1 TRINITY_DN24539_c0_g1~~TRINITY_DN24539_c0_g1_i2.p1  ORF type:complete len:182 (+),score=17.50 TRINITY_DN24539_c0_g1_i2:621-1166(+)